MLRKQCRTLVQIANLELRYVLVILPVNWPARWNEFLPRGYILGLVLVWPIHFTQDRIGISVVVLHLISRLDVRSFHSYPRATHRNIIFFAQELFAINSDFLMNATKFADVRVTSLFETFLHVFFLPVLHTTLHMTFTSAAFLFYLIQFIYNLVRIYLRIN